MQPPIIYVYQVPLIPFRCRSCLHAFG